MPETIKKCQLCIQSGATRLTGKQASSHFSLSYTARPNDLLSSIKTFIQFGKALLYDHMPSLRPLPLSQTTERWIYYGEDFKEVCAITIERLLLSSLVSIKYSLSMESILT